VPNPSVISIKKNRNAQRGDIGRRDTASGYATNASPAPNLNKKVYKLISISANNVKDPNLEPPLDPLQLPIHEP
jgi:hypothetical protein